MPILPLDWQRLLYVWIHELHREKIAAGGGRGGHDDDANGDANNDAEPLRRRSTTAHWLQANLTGDGVTSALAQRVDPDRMAEYRQGVKAFRERICRLRKRKRQRRRVKAEEAELDPDPDVPVPSTDELCAMLHIIETNCHSRPYADVVEGGVVKEPPLEEEEEEHVAIWLLGSMMDHSCCPNAMCVPQPRRLPSYPPTPTTTTTTKTTTHRAVVEEAAVLEVRALRTVHPGDPVTISYTDMEFHTTHERQRVLARRGFQCACPMCTGALPDVASVRWCCRRRGRVVGGDRVVSSSSASPSSSSPSSSSAAAAAAAAAAITPPSPSPTPTTECDGFQCPRRRRPQPDGTFHWECSRHGCPGDHDDYLHDDLHHHEDDDDDSEAEDELEEYPALDQLVQLVWREAARAKSAVELFDAVARGMRSGTPVDSTASAGAASWHHHPAHHTVRRYLSAVRLEAGESLEVRCALTLWLAVSGYRLLLFVLEEPAFGASASRGGDGKQDVSEQDDDCDSEDHSNHHPHHYFISSEDLYVQLKDLHALRPTYQDRVSVGLRTWLAEEYQRQERVFHA